MSCITISTSSLTSECVNSGGISQLRLNGTDINPYPDRSSVEEKYTFDPSTGVGYVTTSINIEFDYTALTAPVLTGLAKNASLTSIYWTTVAANEAGSPNTLPTVGKWEKTTFTQSAVTYGGGSAFLTEGSFLSGQKLEDGSKVTMKIEVKSQYPNYYSATAPTNEPTEESIPESE